MCTELLPAIYKRYGTAFALLEIPEVLHSDMKVGDHGTIYFRDYRGEKYDHGWNEGDCGAGLGTELSSEMVQLLEDLRQIDVDWLLSPAVGKGMTLPAFDFQDWLLSFQKRKSPALGLGISDNEFKQAEEFIKGAFQLRRRIFSNGDFYPRNLIKFPDKVVVVDWEYWPGHRACLVDYLVNVAAFAFIHMWGNSLWREEFVRHLKKTFEIKSDDLRNAVLIKSFEQAIFFQAAGAVPQAQAQAGLLKMALKNETFTL